MGGFEVVLSDHNVMRSFEDWRGRIVHWGLSVVNGGEFLMMLLNNYVLSVTIVMVAGLASMATTSNNKNSADDSYENQENNQPRRTSSSTSDHHSSASRVIRIVISRSVSRIGVRVRSAVTAATEASRPALSVDRACEQDAEKYVKYW